jgi:ribonuclease P protein component
LTKPPAQAFPRTHRLGGRGSFDRVYSAKVRASRGVLSAYAVPNNRDHLRLGLSVGRPVGNAVVRNRIKRLLREAFRRLERLDGAGYDLVIVVRRAAGIAGLQLADCRRLLAELLRDLQTQWRRRGAKEYEK